MKKSPWLGLLAVAAGLVLLLLPKTETYSNDGITSFGQVQIHCGSSLDSKVEFTFSDPADSYISTFDPVFEGGSADQICRKTDSDNRRAGFIWLGIGAAWIVVALVVSQNSKPAGAILATSTVPDLAAQPVQNSVPATAEVTSTPAPTPAPVDEVDQTIVVRPDPDRVTAGRSTSATLQVVLEDGARHPISEPTVFGRNPRRQPTLAASQLVTLDDPARSLSASHLVIGPEGARLWVEDLASTNGTVVVKADGTSTVLIPDQRAHVAAGGLIRAGDRVFAVEYAPSAPVAPFSPTEGSPWTQ